MVGRNTDEANAKAQTWLDRATSLWEVEGVAMEDRWLVGGRLNEHESLVGNMIPADLLDDWTTEACRHVRLLPGAAYAPRDNHEGWQPTHPSLG
jgi:hypothetical protein